VQSDIHNSENRGRLTLIRKKRVLSSTGVVRGAGQKPAIGVGRIQERRAGRMSMFAVKGGRFEACDPGMEDVTDQKEGKYFSYSNKCEKRGSLIFLLYRDRILAEGLKYLSEETVDLKWKKSDARRGENSTSLGAILWRETSPDLEEGEKRKG